MKRVVMSLYGFCCTRRICVGYCGVEDVHFLFGLDWSFVFLDISVWSWLCFLSSFSFELTWFLILVLVLVFDLLVKIEGKDVKYLHLHRDL